MFVRITSQKSYRPIYITIKRLQNIICFRHRFVSFSCSSSEVRTRLTRSQNKRKEAKQPHRILSQCYAKSCSKIKLFRKFVYRATFRPVTNIIRSQPRPPTLLCLYFLTKCPAVARIADRTHCQLPSKSSKVDDFHLTWKSLYYFLLVINSNQGPIPHGFRNMALIA